MSAARKPTARPRRLVLVRGGLDGSHTGDGDGDWEDFCRRIGWQTPAPEPDDDFERRLQEGLLAMPISPDNAVEIEGARSNSGVRLRPWLEVAEEYGQSATPSALDIEAAAMADFGPEGAADRPRDVRPSLPRRGWVRVGVAAMALAVAAAAALAVTRLATSPAGSKAASIAAPSAEKAHETAPLAPDERATSDNRSRATSDNRSRATSDNRSHPVEALPVAPLPLETGPVRATTAPAPTVKPAPGPTAPRVEPSTPPDTKPEPPGTRVAHRSPDDGVPDGTVTEDRAVLRGAPHVLRSPLREDGPAKWARAPRDGFDVPSGEARPVMASLDVAGRPGMGTVADPAALRAAAVRSLVARPAAGAAAVAPAREPLPDVTLAAVDGGAAPAIGEAGGDVWAKVPVVTRPAAAEGAGAANASWSLAGAKDRWVGASLAPPPPPLATSNIGVIVQLDLGKALGKL